MGSGPRRAKAGVGGETSAFGSKKRGNEEDRFGADIGEADWPKTVPDDTLAGAAHSTWTGDATSESKSSVDTFGLSSSGVKYGMACLQRVL